MSSNLENDRTVTTNKMYPIDLAPQKITIVKSVPNNDLKMTHLIQGQTKTTASGQLITHPGSMSLTRPAAQIISPGVASQTQMIVTGAPLLQSTQIVSQGAQLMSPSSQVISQAQLIGQSGQIINTGTQIISQGTQITGPTNNIVTNNIITGNSQVSVTPVTGNAQVLSVGGQLMSGTGNLVVSSSVRTLPPSVRVLSPLPPHNSRPMLSSVSLSTPNVTTKASSHVPRGPAAGASLAVPRTARPATPVSPLPISSLGGNWSGQRGVRGVVYTARAAVPRVPPPRAPTAPAIAPHTLTVPATSGLSTSGVIASSIRGPAPRTILPVTPTNLTPVAPRPLPLLQRNYQTTKVVGANNVGVRPVGNSAPSQLYYEVSRPPAPRTPSPAPAPPSLHATPPRPSYNHVQNNNQVVTVNTPNPVHGLSEGRLPPVSASSVAVLPRPSILRKREVEGSPTKSVPYEPPREEPPSWEAGSGGSTTVSAASSPAPEDEITPPRPTTPQDISPRKKPRKQVLSSEVRHCDFPSEESPATPPPAPVNPPPKRPQLSSGFVCGWRATALHFARPSDVRRREPRAPDMLALAGRPRALNAATGWKVHHITAQMDDLVSLEADVGEQLASVLRTLESAHGKAQVALTPVSHSLLELVKGNIQRSRIVCEGIQEAREDILRVFTHHKSVTDILARQADKRCFRKHRSQS